MTQESLFDRVTGKLQRVMAKAFRRDANGYKHSGERVVPDFEDENFRNHFRVYQLAAQFVRDKDVMDCGCGTGYGSAYLAEQSARSVTGIDFSAEAVAYCKAHYHDPRLRYLRMDAQKLKFPDASFDFVFSSENFEHLPDGRANVSEIRRVLRPGGLCLIATPNREWFSAGEKPSNPFHIKEYYYEEFRDVLAEFFREVHIFENTLESPSELGRKMKADRVRRGAVGLDPKSGPKVTYAGRDVDLELLHNTHSFLALAW